MPKRRLKICFLSAYSGSVNRGIERWVKELGCQLAEKGHYVRVYQLGSVNGQNYETRQVNLKIDWQKADASWSWQRLFGLDYWSQILKQFTLKALPDIAEFAPDIIIPLNGGPQNWLVKKYCRQTGANMVLVGHWNDLFGLWQKPDLFIAISDKQERWAREVFQGKIIKIFNGVNLKEFTPEGEKYPIKVPHPIILTVGALVKGKNIDTTIRAVSQIPEAGLVVCGDGVFKKQYQKLGQKLLGEKFQLLTLEPAEMPSLYRACHLFTLIPDRKEAFGSVFLEAMASGLGVVTINDEIRRKIVGPAGITIGEISQKEYVQALSKALKMDFSRIARKQAEKYSWTQAADKYEQAFMDILK